MRRHLISIDDLSDEQLRRLVARSHSHAREGRRVEQILRDRVVGILFLKTSTRTRTSFTVGALRLGAQVISYGPHDLQINTGESIEDTGRVLAGMLDALVVRSAGPPQQLRLLAGDQEDMAVINAMTADEHPTQAIADLMTITRELGRVDGVRVLYLGEGNNTASALALALTRFPRTVLHLRTPPGYGLDPAKKAAAMATAERCGSELHERHDVGDLPEVDVVYATRWQTTGTSKPDPGWRDTFAPFKVTEELMRRVSRGTTKTIFMHDLPAHRGEDVEGRVLDGPASVAFGQAHNKMYSAMAVLEHCLGSDS